MVNVLEILKEKLVGTYVSVYAVYGTNVLEEEFFVGYYLNYVQK